MTLPYLFMFLSACCIAARAGFGVAAVFARCMRAAKIGAGGTASQRRTGAGTSRQATGGTGHSPVAPADAGPGGRALSKPGPAIFDWRRDG